MKKKVVLGTSLIILFSCFLIFLYFKNNGNKELVEKREKIELIEKDKIEIVEEKIESANIIEDVSYSAKDIKGNNYFLKASQGTIDQKESKYIFLKSVNAIVDLKNYSIIEISSDFGKYNIDNYDTIFSKNVIITYLNNKIKGNYLDFSLNRNSMIISKDVIYTNLENMLRADVIEIDIKTKNTKIFMLEDNKKVNIKSIN